MFRWDVWKEGETITIEAQANGFLRHQIRRANGLLIEIGKGRLPEGSIVQALRGDLPVTGQWPSIPARGLCLIKVSYPANWPGKWPGNEECQELSEYTPGKDACRDETD